MLIKNIYVLSYCMSEQSDNSSIEEKQKYFKIYKTIVYDALLHLVHSSLQNIAGICTSVAILYILASRHVYCIYAYTCTVYRNRVDVQYGALMILLQINYRLLWYFNAGVHSILSKLFASVLCTSFQKCIILISRCQFTYTEILLYFIYLYNI